jgi:hypothetical protein
MGGCAHHCNATSWKDFVNAEANEDANALFWELMQTLPIGVLGGEDWYRSWKRTDRNSRRRGVSRLDSKFRRSMVKETKKLLVRSEPNRWNVPTEGLSSSSAKDAKRKNRREGLPSDQEIGKVIDFMFWEHFLSILLLQEVFFSDIDPHDEKTGVNAFVALQKNNAVMERFAEFSKNEPMRSHFAKKRLAAEAMMRGF